jgi:phage terminase large subunit-like protein
MERQLTHDGDPRLARHLANCQVKPTPHGDVIVKADKDSPAKIDLAVAAVVAYSRAHVAMAPRSPLVVL